MKILKNFIIGLLVSLVFLATVDVLLRFYLYKKYGNKGYLQFAITYKAAPDEIKIRGKSTEYNGYYKFIPGDFGERNVSGNGKYTPITINSLGFRNAEFLSKKKEDVFRICIFGDSATFGVEVGDTETYPFYMQQLLNKYAPSRYEVINCGFPSYRLETVYYLFKNEVIKYQPDLIIVNSVCNDCFRPTYSRKTTLALKVHKLLYNKWIFYTLLLEKYSTFVNLNKSSQPFFCYSKQVSGDYVYYLKSIIAFAKENNMKIVLVKEPMNFPINGVSEDCAFATLEEKYATANDFLKKGIIAYYYYNKQLINISKENNILLLDLTKSLSQRSDMFLDIVHLRPKGYRLLATLIVRGIKSQI